MAREDWRDPKDERPRPREDFGQADYSRDYAYDPRTRSGYRPDYGQADSAHGPHDAERGRPYRGSGEDRAYDGPPDPRDERSWMDRAGQFFGGRPRHPDDTRPVEAGPPPVEDTRRRRGPSDRVLWAVVMERLDSARVDMRDVKVTVRDGEVTLDGTVKRKGDKRRLEDLADVDGVLNVQNNLRPRDVDRHWTIL